VRGSFRRLEHDHLFVSVGAGTCVTEILDFEAPFGILGRIAERLVLARHMRQFLGERNRIVKAVAESDEWRRFLPVTPDH
jgi:hypothetical protein